MRRDLKWLISLAVLAASLSMSIAAAETVAPDLKTCKSIKQADEQIACYTRIIDDESVAPNSRAAAYSGRSTAVLNKGDIEQAIDDATKAIEINPKDHNAYFARAYAYAKPNKNEVDLAIADYTRAIEIEPRDANSLINRAILWDNKGDHDLAIKEFDQILAMHSAKTLLSPTGLTYTYNNRGVALQGEAILTGRSPTSTRPAKSIRNS